MGLDKNNTNQFYLLGRFWAVVEMCNEARFSPTQVDQLFLDPTSVWRFDLNKQRNTDEKNKNYNIISDFSHIFHLFILIQFLHQIFLRRKKYMKKSNLMRFSAAAMAALDPLTHCAGPGIKSLS